MTLNDAERQAQELRVKCEKLRDFCKLEGGVSPMLLPAVKGMVNEELALRESIADAGVDESGSAKLMDDLQQIAFIRQGFEELIEQALKGQPLH